MKIAHIIWSFKVGGAELMLIDIANQQVKQHDVCLFIVNDDIDTEILPKLNKQIKLVTIGRRPGSKNPWYLLKTLAAIKLYRPDVLHAHQFSLIDFIRWLHVPRLVTVHDTRIPLDHKIELYDKIVCISESVAKDVNGRMPGIQTDIVFNGIRFDTTIVKKSYGNSPFRIIQIGRLGHMKKGQDVLIKALHIASQNTSKSIIVDFAGVGESLHYLQDLANELGVADQCRFLGKVARNDLYESLHNYDLLVQPSRNEGFGLTVVEAMAAGVPVLVSDIEGPMEIIKQGDYGYSFANEDPESCARSILKIMEHSDQDDFPLRQSQVLDYAKNRFDIKLTASNYIDKYKDVIAS